MATKVTRPHASKDKDLIRGGEQWLLKKSTLIFLWAKIAGGGLLAMLATYFAHLALVCLFTGKFWSVYWRLNLGSLRCMLPMGGCDSTWMGFYRRGENLSASEFMTAFDVYLPTFWSIQLITLLVGLAAAFAVSRYMYRGFKAESESFKDEEIRGAGSLRTAEETNKITTEHNTKIVADLNKADMPIPPIYHFATVVMPIGIAQRNFLITGSQGTGKTVIFKHFMSQVAALGKTIIDFDPVCEFNAVLYRENTNDVIFNPLDKRFPGWNIFGEIKRSYDYDAMATYLIPLNEEKTGGAGKFFVTAARVVFSVGLKKLRQKAIAEGREATTEDVVRLFFETPQDALAEFLKGTAAFSFVNPEAKSSGDVLSTLTSAIYVLQYVKSGDFSLRDFIRKGGDRRIFITSKEEVHDVLQTFTAMAIQILYKAVMNGNPVHEDKYWFFLDEVHSMGMLPALEGALTKSRKFGAVTLLGLQTQAQLTQLYGESGAKILLDNAQNFLILRVSDPATQKAYSEKLGSTEIYEISESTSHGPSDNKDASGTQTARKERTVVMPSEIKMLADCSGFLQLAGPYEVTYVEFRSLINPNFKPVCEGWTPREDLDVDFELDSIAEAKAKANNISMPEDTELLKLAASMGSQFEQAGKIQSGSASIATSSVMDGDGDDPTIEGNAETSESSFDSALAYLQDRAEPQGEESEAAEAVEESAPVAPRRPRVR